MVKVGSLFKCDRCGKTRFYENDWGTECVNDLDGWGERLNNDLCPECLNGFDSTVENFFTYIEMEVKNEY